MLREAGKSEGRRAARPRRILGQARDWTRLAPRARSRSDESVLRMALDTRSVHSRRRSREMSQLWDTARAVRMR